MKSAMDLGFRVNTPGLLKEIADSGLDRGMGVLKIPLNIFQSLLAEVAEYAAKKDDPELNLLMLRLGLYEIDPLKTSKIIENEIKRYNENKK